MKTLESVLIKHPFFENLEDSYLNLMTGCAKNIKFDAGQFIYRQDEEANQFYIIRQGKVALEICPPGKTPVTVQTVNEGEILGWAWLVPPYRWRFDARATELTRAIALDGKCLRKKCEEDKNLGYELLKRLLPVIGRTMEATRLQLVDVYGKRD
ncbi:MAG: cyclic nucleotide-binding domain-containing protein [Nitrospina sp.]|jgi:CRP-like cAMP-binding protein|nr:cyclic nucleotide-binding domain-containing protein [Nitrospina sp.]MBT3413568.1 cyclic nucleotide-binding domain-containing protein [Nitrospina sp.]MBT3856778.1 cyclic nucleotide-binding domain-containing protein [Nitrospina sp.]MBT4104803.1 cyclic nucleotide-binding domain-containing protein [Nitrospina sp.]MBT4388334.1 cyclic nucleotide-binding domain-containing protein [Nitrospina sp.]